MQNYEIIPTQASIGEISRWIIKNGVAGFFNSYEMAKAAEVDLQKRVVDSKLVMAALVAGFSVHPRPQSTFFSFKKEI